MHTTAPSSTATRLLAGLCAALAAGALAGCAAPTAGVPASAVQAATPDLLLLGEVHDAPGQAERVAAEVEALAARGALAALALEMAPAGTTTVALPRDAADAALRQALQWDARGWPWERYAGAIRAAVRAGVPVVGANLPAAQNKVAMEDVSLDAQLGDAARALQEEALREGHCGLLPARRLPAMLRVQTARDREMAHVAAQSVRPGATVVLWAGSGHVDRRVGVPQHLPTQLAVRAVALVPGARAAAAQAGFDTVWPTPDYPRGDVCAPLRAASPTTPAPAAPAGTVLRNR